MTKATKTILIVLILIVVFVWGYFHYRQIPPVVSENASQSEVKDWKTYTDEKYGFEFKYPSIYSLQENTVTLERGDVKTVSVTLGDIPNVLAIAEISVNSAPSTDQCYVPFAGPKYTKTVTNNGITFFTGSSKDQVMGLAQMTEGYSTIHNRLCYKVDLKMDYGRDENGSYDPKFDVTAIEEAFDQVFSTFKFTK
jgi:hypothetical protein